MTERVWLVFTYLGPRGTKDLKYFKMMSFSEDLTYSKGL